MPIVKIDTLRSGTAIGLWKIDETVDELLASVPSLSAVYQSLQHYKSKVRILESLAVHALLYSMTGESGVVVGHKPSGCPVLAGWHISISHTKGYAAVILSRSDNVAVDIEYFSTRVSKIADRFIRSDETCPMLAHQLICWCVKETVYKYFSEQELAFPEMRLQTFTPLSEGVVTVDNLKTGVNVDVFYRLREDYVLTFIGG